MDVYSLVGLAGVAGSIASYGMVQLGLLDGNSSIYSLANSLAASLLLLSLSSEMNSGIAILSMFWIMIGLVGLTLRGLRTTPRLYGFKADLQRDIPASPVHRVPVSPSRFRPMQTNERKSLVLVATNDCSAHPTTNDAPVRSLWPDIAG